MLIKHLLKTIVLLTILVSHSSHSKTKTEGLDKETFNLPVAISNNAVAAAKTNEGWHLFSFNGLTKDKDWRAVSNHAMGFNLSSNKGYLIDSVPYQQGRLASIAATVNNQIYLFGGYTVAADHSEKSMPNVYRFDPQKKSFQLFSKMPTPVDDSVALVYQQRYIYLISGWHDVGNISDVQVIDTQTGQWHQATPFPGKPVFGHAAGIIGNQMLVVDGVKVAAIVDGKRQYKMSPASYLGIIDHEDFTQISWQLLPAHPGKAKYRMAAVGVKKKELIIFAAGSENPYNYNGIGYNGVPSEPSDEVFAWHIKAKRWINLKPLSTATMDHRGLLEADGELYIVGGMLAEQRTSGQVLKYSLESE